MLGSEHFGPPAASDGEARLVRRHLVRLAAFREVRRHVVSYSGEARERCAEMKRDTATLEDLPDVAGDVGVERGKDFVVMADHGDLGAEVAERARHLETDDARAHDDETPREDGKEQDLVRGDRRFDAR